MKLLVMVFVTLAIYCNRRDSEHDRGELAADQKDREEAKLACQLTEVGTLQIEAVSIADPKKRLESCSLRSEKISLS
ncbi:hypothetical protein [Photobacterium leiognathi]|uniref:hypothetical protein n=1 Tax=Photobacterium leiognathi TaxID=553611 RepID=UPI00273A02E4|nr:hypothetical protein [Photobacterium leiognathi]